jgi:hypothetical protein
MEKAHARRKVVSQSLGCAQKAYPMRTFAHKPEGASKKVPDNPDQFLASALGLADSGLRPGVLRGHPAPHPGAVPFGIGLRGTARRRAEVTAYSPAAEGCPFGSCPAEAGQA